MNLQKKTLVVEDAADDDRDIVVEVVHGLDPELNGIARRVIHACTCEERA
ncbi:hypothetical protein [Flaviaesturariibacter aridisoli]|nr:hypothetical protein [Flaviaesturariibacter aridisoli]